MKTPRVAFSVYQSAFQSPGGGEVQLMKTKEYLEKAGVSVKLFDTWNDKLTDFDILHIFGSVKDSLGLMEAAKALNVKIALSTVCWYSWKSAWGTYGSPKDKILAVLRHAAKCFLPFIPSMRKRMMEISDVLLPNSQSEAKQVQQFFGVNAERIHVVPNGVDAHFAHAAPDAFIEKYGIKDFVLYVGRIEPRKNQLNMVRALSGLDFPVVFIGAPVPKYQEYYDACRREAGKNIHFLGALPHTSNLIASAYAACNTFALPSWLETPGLAALEAGLAGAKVVITKEGATKEYFKDFAAYVDPGDIENIRRVVSEVYKQPKSSALKNHILQNYLWENAAKENLAAYQRILA